MNALLVVKYLSVFGILLKLNRYLVAKRLLHVQSIKFPRLHKTYRASIKSTILALIYKIWHLNEKILLLSSQLFRWHHLTAVNTV